MVPQITPAIPTEPAATQVATAAGESPASRVAARAIASAPSGIRSHWRGWNIVLFEDRAGRHTSPDSRGWAEEHGIEVRLLPKATPELNAIDHLRRHTKREAPGDRETVAIDGSALDACRCIIEMSPRERLRKARVLSENFWLT